MQTKPKVICLGMPRTGTMSLRQAFEVLGYTNTYHLYAFGGTEDPEVYELWPRFFEGPKTPETIRAILDPYEAVFDYPGSEYPDLLVAAYPHAKFILNKRDPEAWERSFRESVLTVAKTAKEITPEVEEKLPHVVRARHRMHRAAWWCTKYEQLPSKDDLLERLHRHYEHVRQIVPASQLLEYNVGDGWDKICKFMECDIPDAPFPHLNNKTAFWKQQYTPEAGDRAGT